MDKTNEEQWKDLTNRHMGDIYHTRGNNSCNEGDFNSSLDYYKKVKSTFDYILIPF